MSQSISTSMAGNLDEQGRRGPEITPQSSITSRHEITQSQQPSLDVTEIASVVASPAASTAVRSAARRRMDGLPSAKPH